MEEQVSAILLAAGRSRRMGRCKQLLPLPDRPAVVRCIESLLAAGVDQVVVVVGAEGEEVARAVAGFPVAVVRNLEPEGDMASSVRVGLRAVDPAAGSVFVSLCDHPLVLPATLAALRLCQGENRGAIVIPVHQGRKGHPTLFPRPFLAEIETLATLREVIGRHAGRVILHEVADEGVLLEMDTPEDYRGLLERCQRLPPLQGEGWGGDGICRPQITPSPSRPPP